jgi:hypothetical protein
VGHVASVKELKTIHPDDLLEGDKPDGKANKFRGEEKPSNLSLLHLPSTKQSFY